MGSMREGRREEPHAHMVHVMCVCSSCAWAQEAIEADPRNPLAKFERASVLLSEERYRDALAELAALKAGAGCWRGGSEKPLVLP